MQQMLLWEEPMTEERLLREALSDLKDKQNNLRRGLFQRFDQLHKEVIELREKVQELSNGR